MPLRLLHTSDWHVGKRLFRAPREEECRAVLAEIRDLAAEHEVDAVVVSGDVFDQAHPSAEASRIVYQALLDLRDAGATVVVVAGNHDSATRWASVRPLFSHAGVHIVPRVAPPERGGRIVLRGRDGTECELLAMPWVQERHLVGAADLMGLAGRSYQSYAEGMREIIGSLAGSIEDRTRPAVLAGHVFVQDAEISPEKHTLTSGAVYAVPGSAFPAELSYAALGHVHRPQRVGSASVPVHYSGSPMQLDFSEAGERKSVRLVRLDPERPTEVRELPLSTGRPLVRLHGTLDEIEAWRAEIPDECWVALTVRCRRVEPGLAERAREIFPEALAVFPDPAERGEGRRRETLRGLGPRELFRRYLVERQGVEDPPDADLDLFEEVLAESARRRDDEEEEAA